MNRSYLSEEQARELKQAQWRRAHTGIRVEQLYPQVEKIEIHYVREHTSFAGQSHDERTWLVTPQDEFCFVISCLNRECTTIGFDLGSIISSAIHVHQFEITGKMDCEGQEAPDHPEQSCCGSLLYTIRILYKAK